ncbi:MAG: ornithine cyclodeaminase family protein [Acidobacteria bacterium]|nr:ornithine cyclodeaminase family protein [Acidobacteriota bacterium]
MVHITEAQVREALPMELALERVEEAFRRLADGRMSNHPRRRIGLDNRAMLHAMEAGDNESGLLGAKIYATRPRVGAHFVVLLFDAETTRPLATIEADELGRIRTGAASGVATKFLAAPDAKTLGLLGAGWQAETQLRAVAAVRRLERVKVFSRTPEKRQAFAAKMGAELGLAIEPADSPEAAVRYSDIVVTITTAKEPVALGAWLAPGCHINAAGSNHALRRELDGEAVARAELVTTDSIEQARIEAGDLIQAVAEGRFDWDRLVALEDVVAGKTPGRPSPQAVTLFESQGLAAQDLIVAEAVWRRVTGA